MTNTNLPELPQAIGVLAGRRLDPPGTTEFFGYFNAGFGSEYKEPIYTADQMRAYALAQSGQGEVVARLDSAGGTLIKQQAAVTGLEDIRKAAQWFSDNPDSPVSALSYIREALSAHEAKKAGDAL